MKKLLVALVLALATAGAAQAGNWASVEMQTAPPAGVKAGKTWIATFSVLQHGLASQPVDGVKPSVTIRNGARTRTFQAAPAGRSGVYRARVVFPSSGKWSYAVYDGFTWYGNAQTHRIGSVDVNSAGSGFPAWEVGAPLIAAGSLLVLFLALKRFRLRPQPATQI